MSSAVFYLSENHYSFSIQAIGLDNQILLGADMNKVLRLLDKWELHDRIEVDLAVSGGWIVGDINAPQGGHVLEEVGAFAGFGLDLLQTGLHYHVSLGDLRP